MKINFQTGEHPCRVFPPHGVGGIDQRFPTYFVTGPIGKAQLEENGDAVTLFTL